MHFDPWWLPLLTKKVTSTSTILEYLAYRNIGIQDGQWGVKLDCINFAMFYLPFVQRQTGLLSLCAFISHLSLMFFGVKALLEEKMHLKCLETAVLSWSDRSPDLKFPTVIPKWRWRLSEQCFCFVFPNSLTWHSAKLRLLRSNRECCRQQAVIFEK